MLSPSQSHAGPTASASCPARGLLGLHPPSLLLPRPPAHLYVPNGEGLSRSTPARRCVGLAAALLRPPATALLQTPMAEATCEPRQRDLRGAADLDPDNGWLWSPAARVDFFPRALSTSPPPSPARRRAAARRSSTGPDPSKLHPTSRTRRPSQARRPRDPVPPPSPSAASASSILVISSSMSCRGSSRQGPAAPAAASRSVREPTAVG
jgi:hypothetical protein